MPRVLLPELLNPFVGKRVRFHLLIGWMFPGDSIKAISVLGMLWGIRQRGKLEGVKELIEATSGNTGIAELIFGREDPFNIPSAGFVVKPDLAVGKRGPLILEGAKFIEPEGSLTEIETARKIGGGGWREDDSWKADNGRLCPDQYRNPDNLDAHASYTGREILSLYPDTTVICGGTGTGGTIGGIGCCLHSFMENIKIVAVKCAPGQKVPGVRDDKNLGEVDIPWRKHVDAEVAISTRAAYLMTQWLIWVTPWSFGPSSGFALAGAMKFVHDYDVAGRLDELRVQNSKSSSNGNVEVLIICPDMHRPYLDHFHSNLTGDMLRRATAPRPWTLVW